MPVFKSTSPEAQAINEIVKRANENTRRIRALEELVRSLEIKNDSIEGNILKKQDELEKKFEDIETTLKDLNIRLMKIENENIKIKKSLEKAVTKPELEEINNFISLINPIRSNFVTKEEVKKIIKESK